MQGVVGQGSEQLNCVSLVAYHSFVYYFVIVVIIFPSFSVLLNCFYLNTGVLLLPSFLPPNSVHQPTAREK